MQKQARRENSLHQNQEAILDNYNKLASELQGFWVEDTWDMAECPIEQVELGHRKYRYIKFQCSSQYINTEIKYGFWKKFESRDWGIKGFGRYAGLLNNITFWLNSLKLNIYSLTEWSLDKWIMQLRSYLEEQEKIRYYTSTTISAKQRPTEYKKDDMHITIFRQVYQTLLDKYDEYNETDLLEKDIWTLRDLQLLGCSISNSCKRFDFTSIVQDWAKISTKKYIKYRLTNHNTGVVSAELNSIKKFFCFLAKKYPFATETEIIRNLILEFLNYLASLKLSVSSKRQQLGQVRQFLHVTAREGILSITKEQLVYDDDFPRKVKNLPRFIPEEVMKQLNQNINALPAYLMRMTLVFEETGRRMSEARQLLFDCLTHDSKGNPYLRHYQCKMKKEKLIPISQELVAVIREQQQSVVNEWGEKQKYLFLVPKPQGKGQVVSADHFTKTLNKMAYEKNICDSNGKLWHFQSHQFRHTVGTRMVNMGVPLVVIMRYLGHESPEMTMVYATLHDETLRKEVEKYHQLRVVDFRGETIELEQTLLSSNEDLEWFKKNVQARALEHGYCARPKVLGDCDIPGFDGCYNCPYWRTNKSFLPILRDTLERTNHVLGKAQNYGWQLQINKNMPIKDNLEKVIRSLEGKNNE